MTIQQFSKCDDDALYYARDKDPDRIERKIDSFGRLKMGWDFGEGCPAPKAVRSLAKKIYRIGKRHGLEGDAFPGQDGGITVTLYARDNHSLEICIDSDKTLTLAHQIGYGFDYEEELTEDATMDDIVRLCRELQLINRKSSSESSTQGDSIRAGDALQVIHLGILPAEEFRFFSSNAYNIYTKPQYAAT